MKNVHILPTDKPSRLHLGNSGLVLCDLNYSSNTINSQHIYITSDEEIKEGDWFYDGDGDLCKYTSDYVVNPNGWNDNKKIILTTDQDLIKDGVQAIDDTFLEWFVKNPSCEEVEVIKDLFQVNQNNPILKGSTALAEGYKIIIPKEEPKQDYSGVHLRHCYQGEYEDGCKYGEDDCPAKPLQEPKQETLEEAAKKYATNQGMMAYVFPEKEKSFKAGAKWQQEQDRWKTVLEETPPSNIELLVQSPEGIVHLSSWRESYNIFSCQVKSESSYDWKWKTI